MREQAWAVAGHLFVTSPVEDVEHCCRARVYRVQGFRLERVMLAGGLAFEIESEMYNVAVMKLLHRLETYLGGRAQRVSMNLRPCVREGTWTLEN
jgi:hypothetical protein